MKLHLIGDVHGKVHEYTNIIHSLPMGDKSVQLGDMGVGFPDSILFSLPRDHKWFRGNHDDPTISRMHPNYLGDYGYDSETKIFWVGGAYSMDYQWRVEGLSWWRDEELSYAELDKVVDLYAASLPDIVLSHECPSSVTDHMFQRLAMTNAYYASKLECGRSRTGAALQRMFEIYEPKQWFFAHYHMDITTYLGATTFRCLSELAHTSIDVPNVELNETKPTVGFIN